MQRADKSPKDHAEYETYKKQRDEIALRIPPAIFRRYETLHMKLPSGNCVVPLSHDTCTACHINIPQSFIHKISQSRLTVNCPTCGRFLYQSAQGPISNPGLITWEPKNYIRKFRDKDREDSMKSKVLKYLNQDSNKSFFWEDKHRAYSHTNKQRLLMIYSKYSETGKHWWGVSKRDWENWTPQNSLILIMDDTNPPHKNFSFLLLEPRQAINLLDRIKATSGEIKRINTRVYAKDGKTRIQEWQDFDLENQIIHIDI